MKRATYRIDLPENYLETLEEILERAVGLADDDEDYERYQELSDLINHQLIVQQEQKADNS